MAFGLGDLSDSLDDLGDAVSDATEALNIPDDFNEAEDVLQGQADDFIGAVSDALGIDNSWINEAVANIAAGIRVTRRGNVQPLYVVYGTVGKMGVVDVFVGVNSSIVDVVCAVCEGEVSALGAVYIKQGDKYVASDDAAFAGGITATKYVGTDSQTASADIGTRHAGWTSNHRLLGTAYVHLKIDRGVDVSQVLNGALNIAVDVNGKKVFDPRDSQTKFSSNPALCIRDYLTNTRYGKGVPTSEINDSDFIDAANYCDTLVTPYTGAPAQQAIYSCDGVVNTANRLFDNLKELLTCCNGHLVYTGGKWRLLIEKAESSVFTFDADTIIGGFSYSAAGKRAVFNRVTGRFINALLDYKTDQAVVDDTTLRSAQDAGFVLEEPITLPFTKDVYRATDLCEIVKNTSRLRLSCGFTATTTALRVNVGQVVAVTHPSPGWSAKLFRLVRRKLLPDGNVRVFLTEYSAGAYTLGAQSEFVAPAATNLPNPFVVAAPTLNTPASGTTHLVRGTSGDIVSRIYQAWTAPNDPYVIGYEGQAKKSADSVWLPAFSVDSPSTTAAYIAPVVDGVAYDIRVRAINSTGRFSAWVYQYNHVVVGQTEDPNGVSSFTLTRQADGTRQYEWTYGTEPADLEGFRIYWKAQSGGSAPALGTMTVLKGCELTPRSVRAHESNQLPADEYWFAIVAVDRSKNESVPVYIQADLDEPRAENEILRVLQEPTWGGTKTNCFVQDGVLWANPNYTWADLTTWSAWTAWNVPSVASMVYETASIDVGAVIAFTPLVSFSGVGTKTLEIRTSNDNTNWSAWAAYAAQTVTARYLQVKLTLTGNGQYATGLAVGITAPVVDEYFNDVDCSTSSTVTVQSTGVIKLNLTKSYASITYVNPVIQSIPANDEWKATVTGKATTGPIVTFYKLISGTWTLTTPTSSTPVDFYVRGA